MYMKLFKLSSDREEIILPAGCTGFYFDPGTASDRLVDSYLIYPGVAGWLRYAPVSNQMGLW